MVALEKSVVASGREGAVMSSVMPSRADQTISVLTFPGSGDGNKGPLQHFQGLPGVPVREGPIGPGSQTTEPRASNNKKAFSLGMSHQTERADAWSLC